MPDQTKKQCPGSPRFLAWLARHNLAQSSLDASNAVMGWTNRPDARHGVDCECMQEPQEPDMEANGGHWQRQGDQWVWFNSLFRREGIMPKKARKLHYAGPGSTRAACGKRMRPEDPRVDDDDFFAAESDGTLCKNCFRAATNEASPF